MGNKVMGKLLVGKYKNYELKPYAKERVTGR